MSMVQLSASEAPEADLVPELFAALDVDRDGLVGARDLSPAAGLRVDERLLRSICIYSSNSSSII